MIALTHSRCFVLALDLVDQKWATLLTLLTLRFLRTTKNHSQFMLTFVLHEFTQLQIDVDSRFYYYLLFVVLAWRRSRIRRINLLFSLIIGFVGIVREP